MIRYAFFVVLVVTSGLSDAAGQEKKGEKKNIKLDGTIEEMQGPIAKIVDKNNVEWLVSVDKNTKFTYSATAEPDWLKPGMWVRFKAKFNSQGEPQSIPSEITVFTPKKTDKLGVFSTSSGTIANPFTKSLSNVPASERLKEYTVAGRVKGLRKNELMVVAARIEVSIGIGERTKLRVEIPEPGLIRKGDAVSIRGWEVPTAEKAVVAMSLTVTAKEPLGVSGKSERKSAGDAESGDAKK
jgi:hypothetical protein